MRIVDRQTFLQLPPGTVFAKYEPQCFGALCIKGDNSRGGNDFWFQPLADTVDAEDDGERSAMLDQAEKGFSVPLDFDYESRDGLYESGQKFAVWEPADVDELIKRLKRACRDAFRTQNRTQQPGGDDAEHDKH